LLERFRGTQRLLAAASRRSRGGPVELFLNVAGFEAGRLERS
jgi:hypothetical protein